MTRTVKRITLWTVAAVAVAALAIPKLTKHSDTSVSIAAEAKGGGRAGSSASGAPVAVTAYIVAPSGVGDKIAVTGTVLPNEQVDIQSEIPGKVRRILFNEGSSVGKGTLLVKIDDTELQAQLQRANYKKDLAASEENRLRVLRAKDAVSQEEYDVALNTLKTASSDIALLKAQIAKTEIRAPFSGTVGLRAISEGSYIAPTTKIATLSNINPVKLDFSVPEKYFAIVRPGSAIQFTIQGSDNNYSAKVYAVEPKIDQSTRSLQVRAICANSDGRIFPGAFANISLVLKQYNNTIMVPTEAIVPELEGKKVFVAKDGKAESRKVEVGLRTDKNIQVVSGLAAGDTVLTSGQMQLKPGSRLRISGIETL